MCNLIGSLQLKELKAVAGVESVDHQLFLAQLKNMEQALLTSVQLVEGMSEGGGRKGGRSEEEVEVEGGEKDTREEA